MAQKLKEEIRESIVESALECFLKLGYNNASMKMIAQASGISVGNIYNYFKDKEALYDALVMSVFKEINRLFQTLPNNPLGGVDEKIKEFISIYKSNSKVFVMLLENSENTKFENLKKTIIENFSGAIERFRYATTKKLAPPEGDVLIKAFSSAFVNGIVSILTQNISEHLKLTVLEEFSATMKSGLIKRILI